MDAIEISVVIGGAVLIGFVLWYFFGKREAVAARAGDSGVQEIKVTVKGGYAPDVIVVKQGNFGAIDRNAGGNPTCALPADVGRAETVV